MADHLFGFWLKSNDWPRDTASHIFLARAMDSIGKVLFGENWHGVLDITSELPPSLPISMRHTDISTRNRAYDLLVKHRPDRGLTPRGTSRSRELCEEEWSAARDVVSEQRAAVRPSVDRFKGVEQALLSGAESGKIFTAFRSTDGGQFTDMPAWWWNTEKISNRFLRCQINPRDPFGAGFAGKDYCWIFVTHESLHTYLNGLWKPTSEVSEPPTPALADPGSYYDLVPLPGKKQQAVFSAIKSVWPDGRVPRLLSIADIEKQINPVVKRLGDPGGASADNIRRALGLKK
ncbi:hypothetical protein [Bradyrhizobium sp. CCBAU 051011]|uniref:hypothetical protein n=1 Tax=Bradyrhizobium sp. CCBAU 051011 TaxID=858422 RepID=UPI001379CAB8|nr:hypothetical protein [Bradyrhizobium sp. CCBAU 051011]